MNGLLNRLSVRNRIWALVALLICSVVVGGVINVLTLRDVLWQEKEQSTRLLVESGYGVLAHFHALQVRGELSEAAAQKAAKDTIRAMRYDEKAYFWLTDLGVPFPRMVMHTTMPELEGQLMDATQFNSATRLRIGDDGLFTATASQKNLFTAFVDVVNQGGQGFVAYDWPKPLGSTGVTQKRYAKLSYVKKFAPWGWLIGSGVYIDDVDALVHKQAGATLLLVMGAGAALLLLAGFIANSITRPMHLTVMAMRRIGFAGGGPVQRLPVEGCTELAELASGFNDMLGHIEGRDAVLAQQRRTLEADVAQRTIELREANLQLQQELVEHRKAEQVIQESRIRMRALIDSTNESVLLLNLDGTILTINTFGAGRFGQLPEDIIGKNFFALLPKDLADDRIAVMQQVISSGQALHSQDRRGAVFFDNSLYPVKDARGNVESVAIFAKDVTEQYCTRAVDAIFSKLDAMLLKWQMSVESIAQMFCEEILPVFDLKAAWIGRAEKEGQLTLVASAEAEDKELLASLRAGSLRWYGESACGPAGAVIRSGEYAMVSADDPSCRSCCAYTADRRARATMMLPLTLRGTTWGVLALYGRDAQQFEGGSLPQQLAIIATRVGLALESALQQEWLTLLDAALAGVDNAVLITDANANILWVNRALTQLSGFARDEALGKTPKVFNAGVQDKAFYQRFWQTIQTGATWHGDIVNARRDGTRYTVSQTVTPLRSKEGQVTHYVAILEDITQRRSEERIRHAAQFDLLTELPNRSLFFDRLGQTLMLSQREGIPGALMFLDLDHFKEVNDQLGHASGDRLLVMVAQRLREQVRASDTVARLGGDEFTVILPNLCDDQDAMRVAGNIIAALGKPFDIAGTQAHIGVSIGIAFFPRDGRSVEGILHSADNAMYLSKSAGRNCYTFAPEDNAPSAGPQA